MKSNEEIKPADQTTSQETATLKPQQKIIPFLWFNDNAEEAMGFYTSIFKNSGVVSVRRYGDAGPGKKGSVMTGTFKLCGQDFYALNGGPVFNFTPAISFFVSCETEEEIDALWKNLAHGGTVLMEFKKYPFSEKYGWVQDKFGLSWQLNLTGNKQKIAPTLMFANEQNGKAEAAIKFYSSLFTNSEVELIARYLPGEGGLEGSIKHASFFLHGQNFKAMDTSIQQPFHFSPAVSFFVNCDNQQQVDDLWNEFLQGGHESQCGWLKDRYGISWQIVPTILGKLLSDPDPVKANRVMQAMLKMRKLDITELQQAYQQP